MLSVGIDWATEEHVVVFLGSPGHPIMTLTIPDTYRGYLKLLEAIQRHSAKRGEKEVAFAVEKRDLPLVDFLLAHGIPGYYVDPNKLSNYRGRYKSSGTKSDPQDAFILADLLYGDRDQLSLLSAESDSVKELRLLLADRESFVQEHVRLSHRLTACLREYYPEALRFFSSITVPTALEFLKTYPTATEARRLSRPHLKQFLQERHSYRKDIMDRIFEVLGQESIPVSAVTVRIKLQMALSLVEQLQAIGKTIARYDEQIRQASEKNAEVKRFGSLPGAGPVLAGGLYTLFGDDRRQFRSAKEVQCYVGTAPRTIQSGHMRKVCFRYACNHHYRTVLQQLALTSTRQSAWASAYYNAKVQEGKGHQHALRCLADLWVKVIFVMWRDQTDYSEERHLASIARHSINNKHLVA